MLECWNTGYEKRKKIYSTKMLNLTFMMIVVRHPFSAFAPKIRQCYENINTILWVLVSFSFRPIIPLLSPSRWPYEPEATTHDSTIPAFQHSNCERSELTCIISIDGAFATGAFATLKRDWCLVFRLKFYQIGWLRCQGINFLSHKNPVVGPSSGKVTSQIGVSAPCSRVKGARSPPIAVFSHQVLFKI